MAEDYFADGDYNAACSMCGAKFKASQLIKHWQGMFRCERCWEPRQPQDFVRGIPDNPSVPWVQPQTETISSSYCTPNGISAVPDRAIPDCMVPDYLSPMYDSAVTD